MQLFFNPQLKKGDTQVLFSKDESRHITKVLRKSSGDILEVTNGRGLIFEVELITADLKQCLGKVISEKETEKPSYHLHMVVAPTKMNDRFEWFLEKATEIGVHEITPVICENSERKVVKLNRFERILQSALKQSLNVRMPVLNEPLLFSEFIEAQIDGQKFIAHCENDEAKSYLHHEVEKQEKISVLIGPEGDFSRKEIDLALEKGWKPVSLGDNRLRTETAAIAACHTVALANLK